MGRPWQKAAWCRSAIVLLVAIVGPAASGVAAVTQTRVVPAQLVGKWTRTVTANDVKRTGGTGVPPGTRCTLTIMKTGVQTASVTCTNIGGFNGTIVPAAAGRVHINVGAPGANLYSWRVSGQRLTITKIKEDVWDRAAVFSGVWKRK